LSRYAADHMDECARLRKGTLAEISGLVLGLVLSITEHLQKVSAAFRRLAQHLLAERQKLVHHLLYVTCQEFSARNRFDRPGGRFNVFPQYCLSSGSKLDSESIG
jgi:hypothetical protein